MYELVDEKDPVSQVLTKETIALTEEKVCHYNHDLKTCVDITDMEVVTLGEIVARQDHDTRRTHVIVVRNYDALRRASKARVMLTQCHTT